jgi:hypothetical protein
MDSTRQEQLADAFRQAMGSQSAIDADWTPGTAQMKATEDGTEATIGNAADTIRSQVEALQRRAGNLDRDGGTPAQEIVSTSDPTGSFAATPLGASTPGGSTGTTSTSSGGTTISSLATTFLESGFGIVPLITGLFGLFGGRTTTPPPLEKYQMPSAIDFASADTGNTLTAADYDQMGQYRSYSPVTTAESNPTPPPPAHSPSGQGGNQTTATAPQITINVQAMDSQSFLDRSDDLARAVRSAMLNMSAINDVVNEL